MTTIRTSRLETMQKIEVGNKVLITRADSGIKSERWWVENHYYEESQRGYPGITAFGRALINDAIARSNSAKWASENSLNGHWVKRIDSDEDDFGNQWVLYDIFVNLSNENYTYWKLKYEK